MLKCFKCSIKFWSSYIPAVMWWKITIGYIVICAWFHLNNVSSSDYVLQTFPKTTQGIIKVMNSSFAPVTELTLERSGESSFLWLLHSYTLILQADSLNFILEWQTHHFCPHVTSEGCFTKIPPRQTLKVVLGRLVEPQKLKPSNTAADFRSDFLKISHLFSSREQKNQWK